MTDNLSNSARPSSFWPLLIGMVLVALVLFQFSSIASLRKEMAELRTKQTSAGSKSARKPAARPTQSKRESQPVTTFIAGDGEVDSRLLVMEESIAMLNKNAKHLMNRGQVPPDAETAAEWQARFLNPETPVRTMFGTLRLLRSNKLFDEAMAAHAATLLAQSTNNGTTRALLDSLRGVDNAALKPTLLSLATDSADGAIRGRAVSILRGFAGDDPNVEAALWQVVQNDSSKEVRARAEDTLRRLPMTETRQLALTQQAANTGLPFDQRWSALRVLGSSKEADLSQLAVSLAQSSQHAPDDDTKLAYIRAFDDVNHAEFMVPLVNSVQDANAEVRLRATDALVDYKDKDPNVLEWLKVLAESDPDPRVRKEATRAFRKPEKPRKPDKRGRR
jgi:hypothetical protein